MANINKISFYLPPEFSQKILNVLFRTNGFQPPVRIFLFFNEI